MTFTDHFLGSSLSGDWTVRNPGSSTGGWTSMSYSVSSSNLNVTMNSHADFTAFLHTGVVENTFTPIQVKVSLPLILTSTTNTQIWSMLFGVADTFGSLSGSPVDSATTNAVYAGVYTILSGGEYGFVYYLVVKVGGSSFFSGSASFVSPVIYSYYKISHDDTNATFSLFGSTDGVTWWAIIGGRDHSFSLIADQSFFMQMAADPVGYNDAESGIFSVDFVKRSPDMPSNVFYVPYGSSVSLSERAAFTARG